MEQKGSFIGFTFGNRHSSKLGIFRTSKSDRYDIHLLPRIKDTTVSLDGMDGVQYWGSNYSSREIPISFAFYGLTEEQLWQIKRIFNDKKIHDLVLDEEPYKVWSAKLTSIATVKYLCFESEGKRFYCGEGEFTFTAYWPYARSRYQYIEDYDNTNESEGNDEYYADDFEEEIIYPALLAYEQEEPANVATIDENFSSWLEETNLLSNLGLSPSDDISYLNTFEKSQTYYNFEEWYAASDIPAKAKGYGEYSEGKYLLYNAGDVPMHFKLYIPLTKETKSYDIYCGDSKIFLKDVHYKLGDDYIVIDSANHSINGCDLNLKKTKNLYNETIVNGNFFQLPRGEFELYCPEGILEFKYLYL